MKKIKRGVKRMSQMDDLLMWIARISGVKSEWVMWTGELTVDK